MIILHAICQLCTQKLTSQRIPRFSFLSYVQGAEPIHVGKVFASNMSSIDRPLSHLID